MRNLLKKGEWKITTKMVVLDCIEKGIIILLATIGATVVVVGVIEAIEEKRNPEKYKSEMISELQEQLAELNPMET